MKQKHILFALLGFIGTSCSNQDLEERYTDNEQVEVIASISNSRVSFSEGNNVTYAYWQNGDGITLSTPTQENLNYTASVEESDPTTATFASEGAKLKDIAGETVYACYPASSIIDGAVALPSTNTWTDAQPLPFAFAVSTISNSKVNLAFEYVHAFLKLTLSAQALDDATSTDGGKSVHAILVKSATESLGIVSGTFNFEDKSVCITEASNEVKLTLGTAFNPSEKTERSIYIPILPQSGDVAINISLLHNYDGGEDILFEMDKQTPANGFVAGHVYTLTLGGNSSGTIEGDSGEIHLAEAGTLSKYITDENKYTIKSLKLSGYLNGDDIKLLREMCTGDGILTDLDVAEATIVEGGTYYYGYSDPDYTENNVWGDHFFTQTKLENVVLPVNIISIGKDAFSRCESLNNVIIPEGVTSIGNGAFEYCYAITEVSIPDAVTSIGESAFNGDKALESVTIGKGTKTIGVNAFYGCEALKSVTISEEAPLSSIGEEYGCI